MSLSFQGEWKPARHENRRVGGGGDDLVAAPDEVAVPPGQRIVGHDAPADFVGDENHRARVVGAGGREIPAGAGHLRFIEIPGLPARPRA